MGWLTFFLNGIYEVSQQATDTAREILNLRETHRNLMTEKLGRAAGNGHRTLDYLYEHPIVSVKEVQSLVGTTYTAANELVAKLNTADVLHEFTGQKRNRRFIYRAYTQLFYDGSQT